MIATPRAAEWIDHAAFATRTGYPVRHDYPLPDDSDALPDAIAIVPSTFNTINKWAAGIADTYVLTRLAELTGLGVPIVVLPFVNSALARNRVFLRSVDELRQSGVSVLFGEGGFVPHPPRTGGQAMKNYPWRAALAAARRVN